MYLLEAITTLKANRQGRGWGNRKNIKTLQGMYVRFGEPRHKCGTSCGSSGSDTDNNQKSHLKEIELQPCQNCAKVCISCQNGHHFMNVP